MVVWPDAAIRLRKRLTLTLRLWGFVNARKERPQCCHYGKPAVNAPAAARLGSALHDPFMAMAFLALEVIPSLKLTDRGLVDVERFELVSLFAD